MLEAVVSVVNLIKTAFYYVIYCSYKTGYMLVCLLNTTFQYSRDFTESSVAFFTVLYESLAIFLQDNLHFLQQLLTFTATGFDTVCTSVTTIFVKISSLIYAFINLIVSTYTVIFSGINALFIGIGQAIVFLKKLIVLFGSGIWFLITLVPLLLYYLCVLFVTLINKFYQEFCDICFSGVSSVKTIVKSIILFVLDVPVESMAGILIALSLAYIFCQFYVLITSYLKQKLRVLKNWYRRQQNLYRRASQRQQTVQTPTIRGRGPLRPVQQDNIPVANPTRGRQAMRTTEQPNVRMTGQSKSKLDTSSLADEKYCVICQERNKCILLLPCRHLCLCSECTRELRYYREMCPVCRTEIASTMKVYV